MILDCEIECNCLCELVREVPSCKEIDSKNDFQNMKNKKLSTLRINANYNYCRSFMIFDWTDIRNFTIIYGKEHMIWNLLVFWALIFWYLIGEKEKQYVHEYSKFTCLMELGINDFHILLMPIIPPFYDGLFFIPYLLCLLYTYVYFAVCSYHLSYSLIYLYHTFFVISVKKIKGKFKKKWN